MGQRLDIIEDYRERAEEAQTIADLMEDVDARETWLAIARGLRRMGRMKECERTSDRLIQSSLKLLGQGVNDDAKETIAVLPRAGERSSFDS
jgi:hypothetical protein